MALAYDSPGLATCSQAVPVQWAIMVDPIIPENPTAQTSPGPAAATASKAPLGSRFRVGPLIKWPVATQAAAAGAMAAAEKAVGPGTVRRPRSKARTRRGRISWGMVYY